MKTYPFNSSHLFVKNRKISERGKIAGFPQSPFAFSGDKLIGFKFFLISIFILPFDA